MPKVKITVYLDEQVALKLRQIAKMEDRSQAEVIHEALLAYTRKAERPRPKGIGKYRSGRSDVSERAEEILRRAARDRE
ncbi:MAG: ribbon-helix-helix protein, CopG family [Acidobacteriota bacterium]